MMGGLAAYFFFDKLLLLPTALCACMAFGFSKTPTLAFPHPDPAARSKANWFFLAVSVVCGWYGTSYFIYEPHWLYGGILQILSLGLLLKVVPPMEPFLENLSGKKNRLPAPGRTVLSVPKPGRAAGKAGLVKTSVPLKKKEPVWLIQLHSMIGWVSSWGREGILFLGLLVLSFVLFWLNLLVIALLVWTAALGAWIYLNSREKKPHPPSLETGPGEKLLLGLVLIFSALIRFPFLHWNFLGLNHDESAELFVAVSVLKGEVLSPYNLVWGPWCALGHYFTAAAFKVFGVGLDTGRIMPSLFAVLSVYVFFRLCRLFFSQAVSLITVFLFSISWWHLFFSFAIWLNTFLVFFELCAFYFLEKGYREGRPSRFIWAGVFSAVSFMSYYPGRLVPLMLAGALAGCVLFTAGKDRLKDNFWTAALVLLGFLWMAGPFLRLVYLDPNMFFAHLQELNIMNGPGKTGRALLVFARLGYTFLALFWPNYEGLDGFNLPHNPHLDPFAGLLFLLGSTVIFTGGWRTRFNWYWISGLFFSLMANAYACSDRDPTSNYLLSIRHFLCLPFAFLAVARGLAAAAEIFARLRPRLGRLRNRVLALGLTGSICFNVVICCYSFPHCRLTWSVWGRHLDITKTVKSYYPRCHVVIPSGTSSPVMSFLSLYGLEMKVNVLPDQQTFPLRNPATRDVALINQDGSPWRREDVMKRYPHAVWTQTRDLWNEKLLNIFVIPLAEYREAQKGLPPDKPLD